MESLNKGKAMKEIETKTNEELLAIVDELTHNLGDVLYCLADNLPDCGDEESIEEAQRVYAKGYEAYQKASVLTGKDADAGTTSLEISRMLTLSTGHLTEETRVMLDVNDDELYLPVFPKDYGWLICLTDWDEYDEDIESLPDDLRLCLQFADDHDCEWICFDSDSATVSSLPLYDGNREISSDIRSKMKSLILSEEKYDEKSYPISKEVCSKCGACSLVTKDVSGAYLNESEQYYQCISGAERECLELHCK